MNNYANLFDTLAREIMTTDPSIVYTPFKSKLTMQGMFKSPKKEWIMYIYFVNRSKADLYTIEFVDSTTRELQSKFSMSGRHQILKRIRKVWK
jgi:hypothetical protein